MYRDYAFTLSGSKGLTTQRNYAELPYNKTKKNKFSAGFELRHFLPSKARENRLFLYIGNDNCASLQPY